jgi:amino acid transporter
MMNDPNMTAPPPKPALRRSLTLPLVVLYGLGVTIGAGIYVLIGATAGRAGIYAPVAFVLASIVMAFSAASFAELAGRYPVSAGEAAYVREGFGSQVLSVAVGLLVIFSAIVSCAAISIGSTGYIQQFVATPAPLIVICVVLAMGALAAWGIMESVLLAAIFTIIEIGALLVIVAAGIMSNPELVLDLPRVFPPAVEGATWAVILPAGLLAFFAFIGFEDIVNLAEEVKHPHRTLPRAIYLTLGIATLIYFLVTSVAVLSVPLPDLAASKAPLSLVFSHMTGLTPVVISAVAVVATLNGVVIQMIMASRVLYGLGKQGSIPAVFARVHPWTRTPLIATASTVGIILVAALLFPLEGLAEMTSRLILVIFTLVNLSLLKVKLHGVPAPDKVYTVAVWVPVMGAVTCFAFLISGFWG